MPKYTTERIEYIYEWVIEWTNCTDCTCPPLSQFTKDTPENRLLIQECGKSCFNVEIIDPHFDDLLSSLPQLDAHGEVKHDADGEHDYADGEHDYGVIALVRREFLGDSEECRDYFYVQPDGTFAHDASIPKRFRVELARPINAWAREMGIAHACDSELDIEQFFNQTKFKNNQ